MNKQQNDLRPVPGFDGYYADRDGNLYSDWVRKGPRGFIQPEYRHQLKPAANGHGYLHTSIKSNGRKVWIEIHRIVALVFLGPVPADMEVYHNNGIRADNRVENLRYDTRAGNNRDKIGHGTMVCGEQIHTAVLTEGQVRKIKCRLCEGATLRELAEEYGVNESTIRAIKKGRTWKHVQ
jgi:tRNA(Phe) wybutosine-synthesizing methylase Tyw3